MSVHRGSEPSGQAALWGFGDYRPLAARLDPAALALLAAVGPVRGRRVLDVAAGTGNVAVRAAADGASTSAIDLAPRMVELGRERTGDAVRWEVGDAQALPVADASADVVVSAFGLIFAPDHAAVVRELRRVTAPGGVVAFTSWAVDGWMAEMTATIGRYLPPAQPPASSPMDWGVPDTATARLADHFADVVVERHTLPWHFDSAAAMTEFTVAHSPAHIAAHAAAGERAAEMTAAIERLAAPGGGPVRVDADYLVIRASN